jgi:uncharacterized membrane protein YhaH (DUF805 family)
VARKRTPTRPKTSIDWKYLFTSLEGRIGRKIFWIGLAVLIGVGLPIQLLTIAIAGEYAGLTVSLALLYPGFALNVKRAHDRNRPAWIISLFYALIIAIVFMQIFELETVDGELTIPFAIVGSVFVLAAIALTIDLGFLRGTPGKNQYGPDPLKQA